MNQQPAIVFMGTPDFAVTILRVIVEKGIKVLAVITAPDKPAGRGKKVQMSAVKEFCLAHQLNVLTPTNLKDPLFIDELKSLKPDLQVVVAFRMLPALVWQIPPLGTFNLHASLLPQYRGAAPINHCLINGDTETGVTTFFLNHEIDTGNIIAQKSVEISIDDNAGSLHDKLAETGAMLVLETIERIFNGKVEAKPQNLLASGEKLKPAPKIFKDDCRIDWTQSSQRLYNFIRGLSPYPAAHTRLLNINNSSYSINFKIFRGKITNIAGNGEPGSIRVVGKTLLVCSSDYFLEIEELQMEGKKRLKSEEFLRGFTFENQMYFQ
jgi:methionyl-tRNA formyltransferase